MITILNYGLGNIQAIFNIYKRLNIPVEIATNKEALINAKKIILPGVGAFDWAMECLIKSDMSDILNDLVLINKVPVLGICVGMQMMASSSEEGKLPGLGWIDAVVKKFDSNAVSHSEKKLLMPHMGWNDVCPKSNDSLFFDMKSARFYFLHSYFFMPQNKSDILATTSYGNDFTSAFAKNNIYGVQFHPEKSHNWGIQLLKNFSNL